MKTTTRNAISLNEILNNYPTLEKISSFKGYKGNLYRYLIEAMDFDGYFEEGETEPTTIKDRLQLLSDTCFSELCLNDANYSRRYGSFSNCFKEWLSGLPSCLSLPVYYCEIIEFAKEIGSVKVDQVSGDISEKMKDKICENYYNFITVNFFQLFDKYEVMSKF